MMAIYSLLLFPIHIPCWIHQKSFQLMLMGDQPLVPSMGNEATKEFSIQDLQLLAQFLPLLSQRAMPLFYWTSNLFSIVSGCPLLFWSNNLILADTVLSWFSKRVFSAKVCKPAHSHAPKHTEHWTGGRVGRGFIFLLIKPLKNHTHTHNIYIYMFVSKHFVWPA